MQCRPEQMRQEQWQPARRQPLAALAVLALTALLLAMPAGMAHAQTPQPAPKSPSPFALDLLRGAIADDPVGKEQKPNTTVVPRSNVDPEPAAKGPTGQVTLIATMSEENNQRVEQGVRVADLPATQRRRRQAAAGRGAPRHQPRRPPGARRILGGRLVRPGRRPAARSA